MGNVSGTYRTRWSGGTTLDPEPPSARLRRESVALRLVAVRVRGVGLKWHRLAREIERVADDVYALAGACALDEAWASKEKS
mgnify:CR=1 FL=1